MKMINGAYYIFMHDGREMMGKYKQKVELFGERLAVFDVGGNCWVFKYEKNILRKAKEWEIALHLLGEKDE